MILHKAEGASLVNASDSERAHWFYWYTMRAGSDQGTGNARLFGAQLLILTFGVGGTI